MKIKTFFKKRKKIAIISGIVLVLLVLIIAKVSAGKNAKPTFEYIDVTKGNIIQEVDVTGKVQPAEALDFSFETSGKIASVSVKVGDKVKSGQTLATLKNNDLSASVSQASAGVESARSSVAQYQAMLDSQRVKLEELKKGARPEEIQLSQIKVDSAKKSLEDAKKNLEQVKAKADADLSQTYIDCANSAVSAVNAGLNSLNVITDIQYAHFNGNDQDASVLAGAKEQAVLALVGQPNGGRWTFQFINNSYGGARGSASAAQADSSETSVLKALNESSLALAKIKTTLDVIPYNTNVLTATEKANITSERSSMNSQISVVSAKISSIATQKNINQNLVLSAQTQVSQTQSALSSAEQELTLKKSGATTEQIQTQEAAIRQAEANLRSSLSQVKSAQASLASASAMLSKSVITSSINGTVTKVEIKVGEMSSMSSPAISVMTDAKFKMEANIPEADIAKVKIENGAKVTLDAYGSDVFFDAKVVRIDPAETVIEGVSTYKTTFEFITEDERIKSGMTANITISTANANDVLVIPQRALIKKDGKTFVLVSDDGKTTRELEIETGLTGSDGNVELVGGLKEGEKIINPSSVKK